MTKQLTPLEALEKIGNEDLHSTKSDYCLLKNVYVKEYKQIETALKDYEIKKEFFDNTMPVLFDNKIKNHKELDQQLKDYEKKSKALEIIKELLCLKVIELLPNDSDTRLFVECGNFKASVNIPPQFIDLLKEELKK